MTSIKCSIDAIEDSPARNHGQIEIQTSLHPQGDCIMIRIRDNGAGISLPVQNKMFDFLFTTKPVGRGIGLGLAIVLPIRAQ